MSLVPVGAGCYRYPAVPPTPPSPAYFIDETTTGWDSGAHSETQVAGDARLTFDVTDSIAVVCGFTPSTTAPSVEPERVTHGFYLTRVRGVLSLHVWESGAVVFGPTPIAIGAVLDVIRFGSRVSYRVNGATVYTSITPNTGAIKVAASLYGPEDTVG